MGSLRPSSSGLRFCWAIVGRLAVVGGIGVGSVVVGVVIFIVVDVIIVVVYVIIVVFVHAILIFVVICCSCEEQRQNFSSTPPIKTHPACVMVELPVVGYAPAALRLPPSSQNYGHEDG